MGIHIDCTKPKKKPSLKDRVKFLFHWLNFRRCLVFSWSVYDRIPHYYSYYQIKQRLNFKLNEENQIWFNNIDQDNLYNIVARSKLR